MARTLTAAEIEALRLWEDYSEWMDAGWLTVPPRTNSLEDYLREEREIVQDPWPGDRCDADLDMMIADLPAIMAHINLAKANVS